MRNHKLLKKDSATCSYRRNVFLYKLFCCYLWRITFSKIYDRRIYGHTKI